ncbi:MAG: hypothetical protein ACYC6Y_03455 [Thermoguttaceae bacterium]
MTLLGSSGETTWRVTGQGLEIRTTAAKPNEHAFVWKIQLR